MLEKLSLSIALYSWSFWFLCFTLPPDFFHIYSKTTPPKKPATFFVVRDFFFFFLVWLWGTLHKPSLRLQFGPYYLHAGPKLFRFFILLPLARAGLVWPQPCPVSITLLAGYTGPPHTCAAPRSPQECARACNRLCGGYWVVRLTETSQPHSALDAEWSSAWGGSPTRGRCQIPTVAPRNHSHTDGDIGRRGGWGRGGGAWGSGCTCSVECESWAQRRSISLVFTVSCWPASVI